MIRITEAKSFRIPKEILEFVKLYKAKYRRFKTTTDVLLHALYELERQESLNEQRKKEYKRETRESKPLLNSGFTPKEKYIHKLEVDPEFRKTEYKLIPLLNDDQQKDYLENYQELGMSVRDYYNSYIKGEK